MKQPAYLIFLLIFLIEKLLQNLSGNFSLISAYADDMLLIPLLMGAALITQQKLVRANFIFSKLQILMTWLFFSVYFELFIPTLNPAYTQDYWDIGAYGSGALLFYFFLNQPAVKVNE